MKAINLMTSHMRNSLGIDIRHPILSWNVLGGIRQSAYEVTAYCDGEMAWSTGKVMDSGMQVRYEGPAGSRDRITWNVKVWDEEGNPGEVSESAYFEYALLEKSDFKAAWINPETAEINPEERQPASYLVKEFVLAYSNHIR